MRRDEAAEKEEQRILEQSEIEMHQETGTETSNACVVHLSSLSPIPVSEVVLGLFRLPNCWEGSESTYNYFIYSVCSLHRKRKP